jgi:MoaA/NifB/PqqE/SkfB family radical SAM enzyme
MDGVTASVTANRAAVLDDLDRRALIVDHPPFYYSVHLNEPCNQRCIMCVPSGNHGPAELSFDEFVATFDQIKPYAERVALIGGETLMYPHIVEVLELLATYPITVTITTNATMLDDRIGDALLALHGLVFRWSIDGATPETYERIHGRRHFQRAVGRVQTFAARARSCPNVQIVPTYVVMRENLHEVVPFLDLAETVHPARVEFHPVRHVREWVVTNGTGWEFDGSGQVLEALPDEANAVMRAAAARAAEKGIECEVHFV